MGKQEEEREGGMCEREDGNKTANDRKLECR